jgi:hypothetical protein
MATDGLEENSDVWRDFEGGGTGELIGDGSH